MVLDYIGIGISFVALSIYLVSFFFLFGIISRITGKVKKTFRFLIAAICTLVLLRTNYILTKADLINIPYMQEILAVILALFLMLGFFNFYKSISELTDNKRKPEQKERDKIRKVNKEISVNSIIKRG